MTQSYDLTRLDAHSFEHLVNLLALRVLGVGHTGFGPGSDGGRDGYFEGEAPYPSSVERWSGRWYIQAKFHKPHLSKDPQRWLLEQITAELGSFENHTSKRVWPNNWIFATNIDPSGTPETGAFDRARTLVRDVRPELADRFHIWGGRKILDLLGLYPEVTEYYSHFITAGNVLTMMYEQFKDSRADLDAVLRFLVVTQFGEQQYTKLEQAGSASDNRPGIHRLFIDLPFRSAEFDYSGLVMDQLVRTSARNHTLDMRVPDTKDWKRWQRFPGRARVWFVKGGPGQGKSTVSQYFCQLQRAALILNESLLSVLPRQRTLASEVRDKATPSGYWPTVPRIPLWVELKEYAQWYGQQEKMTARGVLTYLASLMSAAVEQEVVPGFLKRILGQRRWCVVFDGLDEVPHDVKDAIAEEVRRFVEMAVVESKCDLMTLCTSRPQGYSGQFEELDGPIIEMTPLTPERALACAQPVVEIDRTLEEISKAVQILKNAIQSASVSELMKTPLQAHIMAILVRDGERPPDRRWKLFNNFYHVIKRREATRELPDQRLADVLRREDKMLKAVHNQLGFLLHARAETSKGAQTNLERAEFRELLHRVVARLKEDSVEDIVDVLLEATTERLVLVSTPDDGNHLRFDIRPLQEFFASEFLYEGIAISGFEERIHIVLSDSHWREVAHFLLSALVENERATELALAIMTLVRLNSGDGIEDTRLLARRLGRGAMIPARLLQEGVFEQDKQMRQQFAPCLEPLGGSTDFSMLEPLIYVQQSSSRNWVTSFALNLIREAARSESIGASIVLSYLLMDDHPAVNEYHAFLIDSPHDYLQIVLRNRTQGRFSYLTSQLWSEHPPQSWLIKLGLHILQTDSPNFQLLGFPRIALEILSADILQTRRIAQNSGFSSGNLVLLMSLMNMPESSEQPADEVACLGMVERIFFAQDWTTGACDWVPKYSELPDEQEVNKSLLFQTIYWLYVFAARRNFASFRRAIECIHSVSGSKYHLIPTSLTAQFPLDKRVVEEFWDDLSEMSEEGFDILLTQMRIGSKHIPRPVKQNSFKEQSSADDWRISLKEHPTLAILRWGESLLWGPYEASALAELHTKENTELMIQTVLAEPRILLDVSLLWGRLLTEAPEYEAELRQSLRLAAATPAQRARSLTWSGDFYRFSLQLPADAVLLPIITRQLVASRDLRYVLSDGSVLVELRRTVSLMINEVELLSRVRTDPSHPADVRLAATVLSVLHPDTNLEPDELSSAFKENYEPSNPWYGAAAAVVGETAQCLLPNRKEVFINGVLMLCRDDYQVRGTFDELFMIWRERSSAPVARSGKAAQWLGYEPRADPLS